MSMYAELQDVRGLTPQRVYDANSEPSVDDVLRFCTNRSGLLDALLSGRGVIVPVDEAASPTAYGWCRAVVAFGAAADAEAAAVATARTDETEASRLAYLNKMWDNLTALLVDGKIELSDAVHAGDAGTGTESRVRGGFAAAGCGKWFHRVDAYAPSYGDEGREGSW